MTSAASNTSTRGTWRAIALSVGQPGQAVIFLMTGLLTAFIAGALAFSVRGQGHRPSAAERILALSTIWLVTPAFAAISFVGIDPEVLYMDAFFDADDLNDFPPRSSDLAASA